MALKTQVAPDDRVKWAFVCREPSLSNHAVHKAYSKQLEQLKELMLIGEDGRQNMEAALKRGMVSWHGIRRLP